MPSDVPTASLFSVGSQKWAYFVLKLSPFDKVPDQLKGIGDIELGFDNLILSSLEERSCTSLEGSSSSLNITAALARAKINSLPCPTVRDTTIIKAAYREQALIHHPDRHHHDRSASNMMSTLDETLCIVADSNAPNGITERQHRRFQQLQNAYEIALHLAATEEQKATAERSVANRAGDKMAAFETKLEEMMKVQRDSALDEWRKQREKDDRRASSVTLLRRTGSLRTFSRRGSVGPTDFSAFFERQVSPPPHRKADQNSNISSSPVANKSQGNGASPDEPKRTSSGRQSHNFVPPPPPRLNRGASMESNSEKSGSPTSKSTTHLPPSSSSSPPSTMLRRYASVLDGMVAQRERNSASSPPVTTRNPQQAAFSTLYFPQSSPTKLFEKTRNKPIASGTGVLLPASTNGRAAPALSRQVSPLPVQNSVLIDSTINCGSNTRQSLEVEKNEFAEKAFSVGQNEPESIRLLDQESMSGKPPKSISARQQPHPQSKATETLKNGANTTKVITGTKSARRHSAAVPQMMAPPIPNITSSTTVHTTTASAAPATGCVFSSSASSLSQPYSASVSPSSMSLNAPMSFSRLTTSRWSLTSDPLPSHPQPVHTTKNEQKAVLSQNGLTLESQTNEAMQLLPTQNPIASSEEVKVEPVEVQPTNLIKGSTTSHSAVIFDFISMEATARLNCQRHERNVWQTNFERNDLVLIEAFDEPFDRQMIISAENTVRSMLDSTLFLN